MSILLYFAGIGVGSAAPHPDAYIAGYAAAIVERDFRVPHASLTVQDGIVRLYSDELSGVDRSALIDTLRTIPGVVRVELLPQKSLEATAENAQPIPLVGRQDPQRGVAELSAPEDQFLPEGYLFDQLAADERWPHFSVSYRYYINEKGLGSTGGANFGETFSLYRSRGPFGGQWEFGLQGGVFSFFDLTAKSKDLVNADYMGGIFTSYRYQDFSTMLRVFHQSSHLGDEFILRNNPVRRVNLSYEQADLLLSYKFFKMLRLYGGGGYLFDQEPADLRPWTTQYGVELESPWKLGSNTITPIFAGDFKNDEEDHWSTNISLRGGLQFENWRLNQRRLQVLIEYFHGHSPNGQFYNRKIETIGLGLHLRY